MVGKRNCELSGTPSVSAACDENIDLSIDRRTWLKWTASVGPAALALVGIGGVAERAFALTAAQGTTIVNAARTKKGTPYKLPPDGFPTNTDCSLLTQWAYGQAGIVIPRTAAQQWAWCNQSSNQPGALIFFATDSARPGVVTHVGINVGNGSMIDANSVSGVVEEKWQGNSYWQPRFVGSGTR